MSNDLFLHLTKSIKEESFHFGPLVEDVACQLLHFVHFFRPELDNSLQLRYLRPGPLHLVVRLFHQQALFSFKLSRRTLQRLLQQFNFFAQLKL